MTLPELSRKLDAPAQRRLIEGWKDPEITILALVARFRISPTDVESLKASLGPKARPAPMSPWWKQERERHRRNRAARVGT